MNKKLLTGIFLSMALHAAILLIFSNVKESSQSTFSKLKKESSIKARLVAIKRKKAPTDAKGQRAKPNKTRPSTKGKNHVEDLSKQQADSGSKSLVAKYLNEIRELVLKNKHKGHVATRLGLTGVVKVDFKIAAPNELKDLRVTKSSNKRPLDESALETVRRVGELPSIPEELGLSEMTVSLEMEFK